MKTHHDYYDWWKLTVIIMINENSPMIIMKNENSVIIFINENTPWTYEQSKFNDHNNRWTLTITIQDLLKNQIVIIMINENSPSSLYYD